MDKFNKVTFIGFGLINSSLAHVFKSKSLAKETCAYSRRKETRNKIKNLNIVDNVYDDIKSSVKKSDLIILGVPVGAMKKIVTIIAPLLERGTIITDVGSVKKELVDSISLILPKHIHFIPGHPIAGTENSGPESGFSELFNGRWCILTPNQNTSTSALAKVKNMWKAAGMQIAIMDAEYHDRVLAITSHIPHLVAFSIVGTVTELEDQLKTEVIKYSAGGFRDFTRIAASDPVMWRDVFLNNSEAVLEMLGRFIEDLTALQKSIRWQDGESLEKLFTKTREIRKGIISEEQD
ncbi:MAG: prephenate/arogenate dehydrogenase family protein [Alphaproteobacteria bacterium]|nr:MAG: prephenate/arogenate dehydrogenase family protein [Alphaproteobacteria bacterium]|tara:strand:- start:1788 stop:2666 length:879 start_codon:yes stop_codon:yes gene_type:complete